MQTDRFDSCKDHIFSSALSDAAKHLKNGAVAPVRLNRFPCVVRGQDHGDSALAVQACHEIADGELADRIAGGSSARRGTGWSERAGGPPPGRIASAVRG